MRGGTIKKQQSRHLRKNLTDAERVLWRHLRDRRLGGWKWRRQYAVGPFIVDFVCQEKKLIIEADGGQHAEKTDQDARRAEYLRKKGYQILRFWNNEVLQETAAVMQVILSRLSQYVPPHPNPLPQGGEGRKVPLDAAGQFIPAGRVLEVREYGRGNVHDTFLVTVGSGRPTLTPDPAGESQFILQRLNTRVFPRPELIMGNLRTVSDHVRRRLQRAPLSNDRRWEISKVLLTRDGGDLFLDSQGACWRALSFIAGARTLDTIQDLNHAREVGYALGRFHSLLSDLSPSRLAVTLPGFHVTPGYLRHYDRVLAEHPPRPSPEVDYGWRMVKDRRAWASVLEEAKAQGRLPLRAIHGDPKVDNVMLDTATMQAVALIDLDTVQPGLVHYDIGDCLRSGGNLAGEETEGWEAVRFEPELGRAILAGYLPLARDFLTPDDYKYLYDAVRLLAFELGLRFFTDYLAGNVYFKARHRDHNLARALVQFKLTESIEAQETVIRTIIQDLRG